jgi:superfamily II DNA or RNA helicase
MSKSEPIVCENVEDLYDASCSHNENMLKTEEKNREDLRENQNEDAFLYPILDDPNFNIKIAQKKEFSDTKYDGTIYNVKEYADIMSKAEFELLPQQAFVRNFMSFQTPYNSLLLFHGLGSGKTCTSIGVCEEMRDYLRQMGINKKIIIVASPNVQDNFKLQLFDERKLKEVDGIWSMKGCLGNKLLKEVNPTGMKGLKKEKIISQVKHVINSSYHFVGYLQFSNEIMKYSGKTSDPMEFKIKNLQNAYNDTLIVIDEVHNIRISSDNENKNVAKNLMFLVTVVNNLRLLLLSATPMFNSYKEIMWLLNLMNMNDRRGVLGISDIFDKEGDFRKDANGNELGKELLIRKATGYVSYVRGENPYTFPFRVYPDRFAPKHTFKDISEYPKYQVNGRKIPEDTKINKLSLYVNPIGEHQEMGYKYIVNHLLRKRSKSLKSFGYTDLQLPIYALNIIYPHDELENAVKNIKNVEFIDEEEEVVDVSPKDDSDILEEIDDIMDSGPQKNDSLKLSQPEVVSDAEMEFELELEKETNVEEINEKMKDMPHISVAPKKKTKVPNVLIETEVGGKKNVKSESQSKSQSQSESQSESDNIYIPPKELTGGEGLKRIMNFDDTKTPALKGNFEYKKNAEHIFAPEKIGKYSTKIKTVCEYIYNSSTQKVSDGIILIYSSYIDAGVIPMALALEEMGFTRYGKNAKSLFKNAPTATVDVRTMKPPTNKKDFKPARYAMITGDHRISPDNDFEVKGLTNYDNVIGESVKVVLITQAGSEGLDFKGIRQVHILEPWYNVNRIEQIVGRGVRNFSHKDLPFEKRNVEIFMHGTILTNAQEEALDLYIYRMAEIKAIKIGKITRLLKEVSVDCLIHYEQSQFTPENFLQIEDNANIKQIMSNHIELENFAVGDMPNSATCDYIDTCEYKCLPINDQVDENLMNFDTYNETFMLMNADKIIQKVNNLFSMRFFYKKQSLFQLINIPKKYPTAQIYAALTQMIDDNSEYLVDKYGRTGHLVNIGDYYLFQPSELNYKNISVYDRSVPIDFKHEMIHVELKKDLGKQTVRETIIEEDEEQTLQLQGKDVVDTMYSNYKLALSTNVTQKGDYDWYMFCGVVMKKMISDNEIDEKTLKLFLVEHICDSLMTSEKIDLLNYLSATPMLEGTDPYNLFVSMVRTYMYSKFIVAKKLTGIVLFDGPSRVENLKVYILKKDKWVLGESEDKRDLQQAILEKYGPKPNMNRYVGFIGFEADKKYMIYKVKDTSNTRSTGFRCDQAGKKKTLDILKTIQEKDYDTKETAYELCVRQEFVLRNYEKQRKDGKTWFVDTETAIRNEFEYKEKI